MKFWFLFVYVSDYKKLQAAIALTHTLAPFEECDILEASSAAVQT